jgi:protein disulfide-isomerase A6
MGYVKFLFFVLFIKDATCMYSSGDDVVQLTSANFDTLVMRSDNVWIIEFYAPWCGHCQSLAPHYKKAASALKGVVKVGAVDCDQYKDLAGKYGVRGFPTIKIFGLNKNSPTDYNGERTAKAIVESGLAEAKRKVKQQLDGETGSKSSGSSSGSGGKSEVIELTDSNFEKTVLDSDDVWLIEFFAPWCGHCKNLAPHWEDAAKQLKGKVKLGALDATVHTLTAQKYEIRGYPTIKYFAGGKKDKDSAADYDGGRTASDIVNWALEKYTENIPPPEVLELTSEDVARKACEEKPLCVVSFLPHILDCNAKCRNDYLNVLRILAERFKQKNWGWLWAEAGSQLGVEEALEVGGFGYPALSAVNIKKMKYSLLRGSFSNDGIYEFLRDLSYGKGHTAPVRGASLPKINDLPGWDGKDGELPPEEDIDLSDVELDDIKDSKDEL